MMEDATAELNEIALFVEAAKHKRVSQAARATDIPTSTWPRRIGRVAYAIGRPLIHRHTRRLDLTDAA